MQKQQQRKTTTSRRVETPAKIRPVYTAAVRFLDGTRDIFHVLNANDLDDARAMVLSELGVVRSIVISPRH